jgi:lipopolysaccharide/colanic/teichoic acid biosynthesis glycosyltransferase
MDTAPLNALSPTSSSPSETGSPEQDWAVLPPLTFDGLALQGADALGRSFALAAKRVIDLTGALAGLAMLAPVMLVLAVLIRIDSPGPVLFRQRRLGRFGREFWIIKFRTMRTDAEKKLAELEAQNESARGVLFKMRDDPRVTPLGRFLRRTNLDELPQLWNVLTGEMSLVGPRPFQMRDCERLKALDSSAFARRLEFPPGLTGAWQVGRTSPTDSEHLLQLDLDYIDRWSLLRDIQLICRTVLILLAGFFDR